MVPRWKIALFWACMALGALQIILPIVMQLGLHR